MLLIKKDVIFNRLLVTVDDVKANTVKAIDVAIQKYS